MAAKVMIAISSEARVHVETLASIQQLLAATTQAAEARVVQQVGSPIDNVRNALVEQFLALDGYTHLLFVDGDVAIPSDGLDKLLLSGAPVALGVYPTVTMRTSPLDDAPRLRLSANIARFVASDESDAATEAVCRWADVSELPLDVDPVEAGLTGFCLIRRDVLEAIERPWFRQTLDDTSNQIPADVEFCRKAVTAGFTPVVEPAAIADHFERLDLSRIEELFTDEPNHWPWAEGEIEGTAPAGAEVMIGTIGCDEWLSAHTGDFLFHQLSNPGHNVRKVSYHFDSAWTVACGQLLDEFIDQSTCTHLLMLGADTAPPQDFLGRALASGAAVAGGCCRVVVGAQLLYDAGLIDPAGRLVRFSEINEARRTGPSEVDMVGFSATLIQRGALEALTRPFLPPHVDRHQAVERLCRRFANEAGIKPTLLPVPCGRFAEIGLKPLFDLKRQLLEQALAAV